MIKIVKGIYGYRGTNGFIEPKDAKSDPFSLTSEKEEELVRKGIAVYVDENPVATSQQDDSEYVDHDEETAEMQNEPNIWDMDYNELKSYAKELGLSAKGSKEELQERISEALNLPPNLTAEIPQ